jgi:hypothetical protein
VESDSTPLPKILPRPEPKPAHIEVAEVEDDGPDLADLVDAENELRNTA